jgi:diguanylate cyclase (GGDEF)-like protein
MSTVISTIILLYLTSLLAGAVAFLVLHQRARDKKALAILGISYLLIGVGSTLAGLGELGALPPTLWTSISLWVGHIGYALLLVGMRALDHRRNRRLAIFFSLTGLSILAIALSTNLWLDERIRSATFHCANGLITGAAAWNIWLRKRTERLPSRQSLAFVLITSAVTFTVVGMIIIAGDEYRPAVAAGLAIQMTTNCLISLFVFGIVKERVERHLEFVSASDELTGIGNRRWFEKRVPSRIMPGDALLILDIDHFKKVNDSYGRQVGDRVLIEFCRRIKAVLRESDLFARIGGEEFVIFACRLSQEKIEEIGERIRSAVAKMTVKDRDLEVRITTSIGICWCSEPPQDIAAMLQVADCALCAAKSKGRNRVEALNV